MNDTDRIVTPEDSAKLLEYLADQILDRHARGFFDTVVTVRFAFFLCFGACRGVVGDGERDGGDEKQAGRCRSLPRTF